MLGFARWPRAAHGGSARRATLRRPAIRPRETRAGNTSPEPFSNIALSLLGDGVVPLALWLSWAHPVAFLVLLAATLIVMVVTLCLLWKFLRLVAGGFTKRYRRPMSPPARIEVSR